MTKGSLYNLWRILHSHCNMIECTSSFQRPTLKHARRPGACNHACRARAFVLAWQGRQLLLPLYPSFTMYNPLPFIIRSPFLQLECGKKKYYPVYNIPGSTEFVEDRVYWALSLTPGQFSSTSSKIDPPSFQNPVFGPHDDTFPEIRWIFRIALNAPPH